MTSQSRRGITTDANTGSPCDLEPDRVPTRGDSGLAFIELLAVLGLLIILLLVAMPQLVMPDTLNATALADQIAVDLRLARQLAVGMRVNYTLQFDPATAPYTSYLIRNESTLVVEPDFPKTISSDLNVSGRRTFTFRPDGCVDDDGTGSTCVGTDGSVTATSGAKTATVQVFWYAGRVKVVEP